MIEQSFTYSCDAKGCKEKSVLSSWTEIGLTPMKAHVPVGWHYSLEAGLICHKHMVKIEIVDTL